MSAPVYKYLLVNPTDMGGAPLGPGSQVADFTVTATFDREIRYSNGEFKAGSIPLSGQQPSGSGGVLIKVPVADDPAIVSGTGFGITVAISYGPVDEGRYRHPQTRTISPLLAMVDVPATDSANTLGLDIIYLSTRGDAVPVPQEYVDSATIRDATDSAVAQAASAVTTANSAVTTANTATNTANQAMATATATIAPTDNQVATLVGTKTSSSAQSLVTWDKSRVGRIKLADYLPASLSGITNFTSYFTTALADAAALGNTVVEVPPLPGSAPYWPVSGLVIPAGTGIVGAASTRADYGAGRKMAVIFRRVTGDTSTNAIIAINGAGAILENVRILGAYGFTTSDVNGSYPSGAPTGDNGPGLYVSGFQSRIINVYIQGVSHAGLWIDSEDDPVIEDLNVRACGNATVPQVVVGAGHNGDNSTSSGNHFLPSGVSQVTNSTDSNTIMFGKRTLVQAGYNQAIDIGNLVGAHSVTPGQDSHVENVFFDNLHLEGGPKQTGPTVIVGPYARGTRFTNSFLYRGNTSNSGPVISYNGPPVSMPTTTYWLPSGLSVTSCQVLGSRTSTATTSTAIDLVNGDYFYADDIKFDYVGQALIAAQSTFGPQVRLGGGLTPTNNAVTARVFKDNRSNRTGGTVAYGPLVVTNKLILGRDTPAGAPTIAATAAAGTGATVALSATGDTGGSLNITTGTSPTAGALCTVTFSEAWNVTPFVLLQGANTNAALAVANIGVSTGSTTTTFTVGFASAPAASTSYSFAWLAFAYR